jgi:hypothetical protein
VPEAVDIAQFPLPIEDLVGPFARETHCARERTEQLDNLRNVVVVLAILGPGLWVKEIVACDEFEHLKL